MRRHPEESLHRAVACFLNVALVDDAFWTTIPAGGGGRVRGAILKAMGYRRGTPDILIVWQGKAYWIELKAKNGRVSGAQWEVRKALARAGSHVGFAYSADEVESLLRCWGIPLRATMGRAA